MHHVGSSNGSEAADHGVSDNNDGNNDSGGVEVHTGNGVDDGGGSDDLGTGSHEQCSDGGESGHDVSGLAIAHVDDLGNGAGLCSTEEGSDEGDQNEADTGSDNVPGSGQTLGTNVGSDTSGGSAAGVSSEQGAGQDHGAQGLTCHQEVFVGLLLGSLLLLHLGGDQTDNNGQDHVQENDNQCG